MRAALFSSAERAVLRASDRVEDQLEPGGKLYLLDRRRVRGGKCPHGTAVRFICEACPVRRRRA